MAGWDHSHAQEVDWVIGACMMLRTMALKQVGFFDESMRFYCEDIDLCFRLWKAGWSVWYNPQATVVHHHQANSDNRLLSFSTLLHYKSMLRYVTKHGIAGFVRPDNADTGKEVGGAGLAF